MIRNISKMAQTTHPKSHNLDLSASTPRNMNTMELIFKISIDRVANEVGKFGQQKGIVGSEKNSFLTHGLSGL